MIREMDLNLWDLFKKQAKQKGRTLPSYLAEAMREKLERDK